jgi:UDP-N-acetylmuramoylalanine--D-glutamate ligase
LVVLELDSWQLQGFGERKISPHISVFTTFLSDHLNYYKGQLPQYFADKANIFKYQNEHDVLILGNDVAELLNQQYAEFKKDIKSSIVTAGTEDAPNDWQIKIPGEHNKYNIGIAVATAKALQIPEESVRKTVENFTGVPGRLEFIREINGVKIYNDTTATTPDATVAALKALENSIVLIMGGADKGLDMTQLITEIPNHAKAVILLPGTGSMRIEKELFNIENIKKEKVDTLEQAIKIAIKMTQPGDKIVLSPAFASFGPPPGGFKNEYDRGEQFNNLIAHLI